MEAERIHEEAICAWRYSEGEVSQTDRNLAVCACGVLALELPGLILVFCIFHKKKSTSKSFEETFVNILLKFSASSRVGGWLSLSAQHSNTSTHFLIILSWPGQLTLPALLHLISQTSLGVTCLFSSFPMFREAHFCIYRFLYVFLKVMCSVSWCLLDINDWTFILMYLIINARMCLFYWLVPPILQWRGLIPWCVTIDHLGWLFPKLVSVNPVPFNTRQISVCPTHFSVFHQDFWMWPSLLDPLVLYTHCVSMHCWPPSSSLPLFPFICAFCYGQQCVQ